MLKHKDTFPSDKILKCLCEIFCHNCCIALYRCYLLEDHVTSEQDLNNFNLKLRLLYQEVLLQ